MTEEPVLRRLSAILAADVAGYSRLIAADEVGTLARFRKIRAEVIDPAAARFGGALVGTAGDSLLLEFTNALAAVECALACQRELARVNSGEPENRRILFRMGVNLGDVIAADGTIHGDGVNVAARIEKLSEPGGLCISKSVFDLVDGKLAVGFLDLGEHEVKNIAKPVRVFRAEVGTGAATGKVVQPKKVSIAVLPFDNMSGDPEQLYFSDGITEDIITELSKFRDMLVIARNSSFQFRGKANDLQEVGKKLGVLFVVEGSVRKVGNRVRITVQLIDTGTGGHVWAEKFDRELTDIFAVQDEIVRRIAAAVPVQVGRLRMAVARAKPTDSLSAQDHFLRGRYAMRNAYDLAAGIMHLKKAVEADPHFSQAHALLAWTYAIGMFNLGLDQESARAEAQRHCRLALAENDSDPGVLADIAICEILTGKHDLADAHSRQALLGNPSDFDAIMARGLIAAYHGMFEEASSCMVMGRLVDPIGNDQQYNECYCDFLVLTGQLELAARQFQAWHDLPVHLRLEEAGVNALLGRHEAAGEALRKFHEAGGPKAPALATIQLQIGMCARETERECFRRLYRAVGFDV